MWKTSNAWLQVYTGKEDGDRAEVNQGIRVVLELTEGLQGRAITCDNFFTSLHPGRKATQEETGPGWHNLLNQAWRSALFVYIHRFYVSGFVFFVRFLTPIPAGGEQIAGQWPSSTTGWTSHYTMPTCCGHQWPILEAEENTQEVAVCWRGGWNVGKPTHIEARAPSPLISFCRLCDKSAGCCCRPLSNP